MSNTAYKQQVALRRARLSVMGMPIKTLIRKKVDISVLDEQQFDRLTKKAFGMGYKMQAIEDEVNKTVGFIIIDPKASNKVLIPKIRDI